MRLSNDGAIPILKLWQMIKTIVSTSTAGLVCASDAMLPSTASGLVNEFAECARAAKRGGTATPYGCCSNQHRPQPSQRRLLIAYPDRSAQSFRSCRRKPAVSLPAVQLRGVDRPPQGCSSVRNRSRAGLPRARTKDPRVRSQFAPRFRRTIDIFEADNLPPRMRCFLCGPPDAAPQKSLGGPC